jgi:hypothetical protein
VLSDAPIWMLGIWIAFAVISAAASSGEPLSPRPLPLRSAAAALAVVATVAALMGAVSVFLHGGTGATVGFRALPLLALLAFGVIAGTLTLIVLRSQTEGSFSTHVKTCTSCGSAVLENWRLCPDCGRFIEARDEHGGAPRADASSAARDSVLPN